MEFEGIVVKESPGLCRCCLSEGCYKDLGSEYSWMDDTEVYADMLLECFDISISQHVEGPNGPNRLICEVCITRLRDACNFKKQVLESEKKFVDMVGRGEFKTNVIVYQEEMKMEMVLEQQPVEETEVEYLDEDIDYDDGNKDDLNEPSVSEDITVDTLPIKGKRGRPRKSAVKPEKKKKLDEKAKTKIVKGIKSLKNNAEPATMRRRKNLQLLFNNTTIIPFKWRGKYLCFYCSKDLGQYSDLRKHTKSHGDCSIEDHSLKILKGGQNMEIKIDISQIGCEICYEQFNVLDDLVDHLFVKHELSYDKNVNMAIKEYRLVDLSCMQCDDKFMFFGYLVSHINTYHPKKCFMCDRCDQKFNKKRDLSWHIKNYHKVGGYQCDVCTQSYKSLNTLRNHKKKQHFVKCDICNLKLMTVVLKKKHMKLKHPDSGSFKCDVCNVKCHTQQCLKTHLRECKGGNLDMEIKEEVSDAKDSDNSDRIIIKPTVKRVRENIVTVINMSTAIPFSFFKNKFNCFYCSKDFLDSDLMREHVVVEHPVCDINDKCILRCKETITCVKIDISSLACKVCSETMQDFNTLIDHLILKHEADYDKSITTCLQPYKLIKDHITCPNCPGEVFKFFGTLLQHMNVKHANNKIKCEHCGKTFRYDQNLRVHIWRHHRDGSFKCNICGADCNIPSRLYIHMAKAHGVKAAKCPKCSQSFATQYLKQKHLIEAHDSGHKCSFCGRMFTRNSFLRDHIKRSHLRVKDVECSVCHMKFIDNVPLRRHMVKHSGQKNFSCDMCGERFYWKNSLRGHMAKHNK